jgi:hypothetical protein
MLPAARDNDYNKLLWRGPQLHANDIMYAHKAWAWDYDLSVWVRLSAFGIPSSTTW